MFISTANCGILCIETYIIIKDRLCANMERSSELKPFKGAAHMFELEK